MTINRPPSVIRQKRREQRLRDPNSLVASAAILTGKAPSKAKLDTAAWQQLAWSFYDDVGELRFGVNWLANALSRVNLIAAVPPKNQGEEPTPIDLKEKPGLQAQVDLVAEIAGGVTGQGQLLAALTRSLVVPGLGYIHATAENQTDSFSTWRALSNDEAKRSGEKLQVADPETGEFTDLGSNDLLIKVWRAHPRKSWEPDSPVRAVLSSLNEIKLLSMRVAADARSRLVGAGLLLMPDEARFPAGQTGTEDGDVAADSDDFIQVLIQVGGVAIQDPDSPAARTPLVATMPGEFLATVQHLKFGTSFDDNLLTLREAAVKRLALGLDMPPEVMLGLGQTNHWSAWQINEEAITLQVEPLAETICHALTIGFLQPALVSAGFDKNTAIVWYDTTDLTNRPDLTAAATTAHSDQMISDAAYRRYIGVEEQDAPTPAEFRRNSLIRVASGAPTMAPVMLALAGVISWPEAQMAIDVANPQHIVKPEPGPPPDGTPAPPDTQPPGRAIPAPAPANAVGLLAAADVLVLRALEKSGSRLRAVAGKKIPGGSVSIPCDDLATLHCALNATEHASLDHLLQGAWDRVPRIASQWGMNGESLTATLDSYARGLLATGNAHDFDRLKLALGAIGDDDPLRLTAAH